MGQIVAAHTKHSWNLWFSGLAGGFGKGLCVRKQNSRIDNPGQGVVNTLNSRGASGPSAHPRATILEQLVEGCSAYSLCGSHWVLWQPSPCHTGENRGSKRSSDLLVPQPDVSESGFQPLNPQPRGLGS